MVYIYKKTAGGKTYYYLRASERKGKKVIVKDIAYLGNSIKEVQKKLDNLSQYKEQIRNAHKKIHRFLESNHYLEKVKELKLKKDNYLDKRLLDVEACKLHFNKDFQKLDKLTKEEILKQFIIEFAFNTTSIEGNTITLNEARNLLEDGKTPKDKTLREIYDLQNTEKLFFELIRTKPPINNKTIEEIHKRLLQNIDNRIGYRTRDVRVIKATFKSTSTQYIKADMNLLLKWYEENEKKLHPIVLASLFHHKFEKIHPFMDGNGRTGRMLLNLILLKNNYPPLIIHKKLREEYLDSMKQADGENIPNMDKTAYSSLIMFIVDELINSYWDIFL